MVDLRSDDGDSRCSPHDLASSDEEESSYEEHEDDDEDDMDRWTEGDDGDDEDDDDGEGEEADEGDGDLDAGDVPPEWHRIGIGKRVTSEDPGELVVPPRSALHTHTVVLLHGMYCPPEECEMFKGLPAYVGFLGASGVK